MSGDATLWCRLCDEDYPTDDYLCRKHPAEELRPRPAAGPGNADAGQPDGGIGDPERPRAVCWKCGTRPTDVTNATCSSCHESLVPPALVIEFPDGPVVLRIRGESADLGRAGVYGDVFLRYPNVSRRHATLNVDAEGVAWLIPNPAAPNGTFVNDIEITSRTVVRPGDQIRFATDRGPHSGPVSEQVRQPQLEP